MLWRVSIGLCVAVLLTVAITVTSCCNDDDDPNWGVGRYAAGQREIDLRREYGAPTSERRSDVGPVESPCRSSPGLDAQRELSYDIPSRGFSKWLRDVLGTHPRLSFVVCVDSDGIITKVVTVEVN
jgi:hypothetical protein